MLPDVMAVCVNPDHDIETCLKPMPVFRWIRGTTTTARAPLLHRRLASLLAENLLDVTDLDDAEGRDSREGGALPAIQLVGPLPLAYDLALGPARQVDVACEHPALVVSSARTIATTARSTAALLRIAALPRFVIPRVVSIEHSSPLVVDTTREGPTAVSGGWWQSSSDLRMYADGAGS